ncbi:MAG: hypothetical protein KDK39_15025 [Leptospiraceae bacterium]|nr:hypothetical protein [Leptospiraceae bacterium]
MQGTHRTADFKLPATPAIVSGKIWTALLFKIPLLAALTVLAAFAADCTRPGNHGARAQSNNDQSTFSSTTNLSTANPQPGTFYHNGR